MIFGIYSILDTITGNYANPFYQVNDASAERLFLQICKSPEHAGQSIDYKLFKLGTFNTLTGAIDPIKPEFLRGALDE